MKFSGTSAEAAKLLSKLQQAKVLLENDEYKTCTFHAALGEDTEDVRPRYNYQETQAKLKLLDKKIRVLKHAISTFNLMKIVGQTGMTIDQVLIYIPQLSARKKKLEAMQARLPKERKSVAGIGRETVIDYEYANYSVDEARQDYLAVCAELNKVQLALDLLNATEKLEVTLP